MCLFCGSLSWIIVSGNNYKAIHNFEKCYLLCAPCAHSQSTLEPWELCHETNLLLLDPISPNLFDQDNPVLYLTPTHITYN